MNSLFLTDGYKTGHHKMYPEGTSLVYSNWTPRSNKYAPKGCDKVVSFGQQLVFKWLVEEFDKNFFSMPKEAVCSEIQKELSMYLGCEYDVAHFEALHNLGFLPIEVKSIKEGIEVPIGVPMMTICNTHGMGWVTNFLETIISNMLWQPMTSATIAKLYKRILTDWAEKTDKDNISFVDWQGHDFSMRGMGGVTSDILSGLGHAASFLGSDSLPVIPSARKYYGEKGFVVGSVNATEHSVMCAGGKESEIETFKRLMNTFPTGVLSVVSDTWDLWKVCTEYLPSIKGEILARQGKLVIRPDSGDPVDILCGTNLKISDSLVPSEKGVIELLWDVFGGDINEQGYKVLNGHIGAIYGDSITPERAEQICQRLADKKFASTNVVLGIGSFTYQYNTRDVFGFAVKSTYVEVNGEGIEIFKNPVTDDGTKKSAKGLLGVYYDDYMNLELHDQVNRSAEEGGELKTILKDGKFYNETTLTEIREVLNKTK